LSVGIISDTEVPVCLSCTAALASPAVSNGVTAASCFTLLKSVLAASLFPLKTVVRFACIDSYSPRALIEDLINSIDAPTVFFTVSKTATIPLISVITPVIMLLREVKLLPDSFMAFPAAVAPFCALSAAVVNLSRFPVAVTTPLESISSTRRDVSSALYSSSSFSLLFPLSFFSLSISSEAQ
jgi:hypothetical protein